jgi:hypothetical protein
MAPRMLGAALLALAIPLMAPLAGAHRNFVPDWTFSGSTLAGWTTLGETDWRVEKGEIVATPRTPEGGWLLLDQGFQDVQIAASVRCAAACKPGLLVRAEKLAAGGMKGVLVSYAPDDIAAYAVEIDAQGRMTSRERLRSGGGQLRFVANPDGTQPNAAPSGRATTPGPAAGAPGRGAGAGAPAAAGPNAAARGGQAGGARGGQGGGRGGGRGRAAMPEGYENPYTQPVFEFKPTDWNDLEVQVDANILRGWLNNGPESGVANGAADEARGAYGPVALYVGGTGEVRFKDIGVKDLGRFVWPTETVSSRFRMLRLSNFNYSWSTAVADINRDGTLDIVAGPWYFLGPDFTVSREIALSQTWNPSNGYPNGLLMQYAYDFTGDGWPDVLMGTTLYINPGKELRRWTRMPTGMMGGGEVTAYRDVDGDGKPDVVNSNGAGVSFSRPDPANPLGPWISVNVSGPGPWPGHGVGAGDINGDGRVDLINPYGWWEQPAGGANQTPWKYHVVKIAGWGRAGGGPGGAEIVVYDVNGDGRNDIVTSLEAHAWGLGWLEQKRSASGEITFVPHQIMGDFSAKNPGNVTFSELHGLTAGDMNGDGIPDIVTGKRYWAHQESYVDPDPMGAPVLYIFRTVRNPRAPGGAEFVPELVHNRSGVGSSVLATDVNRDGAMDIVTGTKLGIFAFLGTPRPGAAPARGGGRGQ